MSRASKVRAFLALAVVVAAALVAVITPIRLGLDLRGGTQIVLETADSERAKAEADSTDRVLEVLRKRVDALGVSEPTLARSGERRIIVELPGVQDPREAAQLIGRTAQLSFHPVLAAQPQVAHAETEATVLPDESGLLVGLGPAVVRGDAVQSAAAGVDPERGTAWFVTIDFSADGASRWQQLTGQSACAAPGDPARRVAIVLDGSIISSPQIDPSVRCAVGIGGGSTQVTGHFNQEEAKDLAALIQGGALPLPVTIAEQRTIGPSLGQSAILASAQAALTGLVLTGLFITVVYRLLGLLASIALACYALISYATLVALGATLTLPGLAGFVLAIGLAIDANVLVFERAREEHMARASVVGGATVGPAALQRALRAGSLGAWSAILDSNVTTLLAAGLMFVFATGPVRGFGITLGIGVLASMVSALVVARALAEWALYVPVVGRHPGLTGLIGTSRIRTWIADHDPDLMRHGRQWLSASALLVLVAVAGIAVRGLNLGVEFTGGRLLEYSTSRSVDFDRARDLVSAAGFPRAVVQASAEGDAGEHITVRTEPISNDQAHAVQEALGTVGGDVTKVRDELIGPTLGTELRSKALIALGFALVAQLVYLAVRFRWTFGTAAVLTMLHDVLIVVGAFAWLGKPVDGAFVAALLTIVGLSVNDKVVVFDRVRELVKLKPGAPFHRTVNTAVLQTVPRTVNTGLSAMVILTVLAVFGGRSLADFAFALLLGLVVGTVSSAFTASPLLIEITGRWRPECRSAYVSPVRSGEGRWTGVDPYADIPYGRAEH